MKRLNNPAMFLITGLLIIGLITACTDERAKPAAPEEPSYNETILLSEMINSSDAREISLPFNVRGNVQDGILSLACFLQAEDSETGFRDEQLIQFEEYGVEIEELKDEIDSLNILKVNYELMEELSPEDSTALANIIAQMSADTTAIEMRTAARDTLDTYLDDKYKVAIRLDDDDTWYYPFALYLDSTAVEYLGGETIVWGQGFYLAETSEQSEMRGKTMQIDIEEVWVADDEYRHSSKPARPSNLQTLPELYPLTDWLERLAPGSHTLHVRFGSDNTVTAITASLYMLYERAG